MILVWGGGAIGGTLAAYWARAGIPVTLVDIDAAHVEAVRSTGLAIEGPVDAFRVVVPAFTPATLQGRFTDVVLAVKAHMTDAALGQLAPHVADDGYVLSAQNGLNERTIAARLGRERTLGCFVNFGADWLGPGRILYGNRGAVVVGELDGQVRDRTTRMHAWLQRFDADAILTDNIDGYLWGKLAYGAMLFATALTDDSMSANFADPRRRDVFVGLGREVVDLAHAYGVTPVGFGRFDPHAFRSIGDRPEGEGLVQGSDDAGSGDAGSGNAGSGNASRADAVIDWLAHYTSQTAKTHSGIWRDLAVRHRATEVDAQVGMLVDLAREKGVALPLSARLVELIHDVEAGRRPRAAATFDALRGAGA